MIRERLSVLLNSYRYSLFRRLPLVIIGLIIFWQVGDSFLFADADREAPLNSAIHAYLDKVSTEAPVSQASIPDQLEQIAADSRQVNQILADIEQLKGLKDLDPADVLMGKVQIRYSDVLWQQAQKARPGLYARTRAEDGILMGRLSVYLAPFDGMLAVLRQTILDRAELVLKHAEPDSYDAREAHQLLAAYDPGLIPKPEKLQYTGSANHWLRWLDRSMLFAIISVLFFFSIFSEQPGERSLAYRMTLPAGLRLEATRRMMVLFSMLLLADLTLIGMSAHHAWRNPAEWQVLRLPIQFIPDYVLCPLQISIGEAFLMMFIFKLLFSWMLAAWSTFFSLLLRSPILSALPMLAILAASWLASIAAGFENWSGIADQNLNGYTYALTFVGMRLQPLLDRPALLNVIGYPVAAWKIHTILLAFLGLLPLAGVFRLLPRAIRARGER